MKKVVNRLQEIRLLAYLTPRELAEKSGVSLSSIYKAETFQLTLSVKSQKKIVAVLNEELRKLGSKYTITVADVFTPQVKRRSRRRGALVG